MSKIRMYTTIRRIHPDEVVDRQKESSPSIIFYEVIDYYSNYIFDYSSKGKWLWSRYFDHIQTILVIEIYRYLLFKWILDHSE